MRQAANIVRDTMYALLGLMKIDNLDIYVTGSNSKMLSSDILAEFKDRGDEVRIYPRCYSEYYKATPEEEKSMHGENILLMEECL